MPETGDIESSAADRTQVGGGSADGRAPRRTRSEVDIEELADRVYRLMKMDLLLDRERQGQG
jgi:hypothetical protein